MRKIIVAILAILGLAGGTIYKINVDRNDYLEPVVMDSVVYGLSGRPPTLDYHVPGKAESLGAAPFRPSEYKTSLAEAKTEAHSDTTLKVNSITTKDGNTLDATTLGDTIVLHISPGRTNAEIVVCTGLTAATKTFTGCTFGYRFDTNSTQSANVKAHSPGETVIISNDDHYQVVQYPSIDDNATIRGAWSFATSTNPTSKLFIGDEGAYFWYNTSTNNLGWASSTAATELVFNQDGTTFSAIRPIVLSGGELKLATSTYDFAFDDANVFRLASSTITGGKASGKRLDDYFNNRMNATTTWAGALKIGGQATSTISTWIGSAGTANYIDLSNDLYVQDDIEVDGTVFAGNISFDGSTTYTKIPTVATSSVANIGTTQTSLTTLQTYTIPANPGAGTVYNVYAGFTKSGANGGGDIAILFNSKSVFVSNTCSTASGAASLASMYINIVFGSIAGTNQEVGVSGICSGNAQGLPGSMATTTISTAETHPIAIQAKAASGDTMLLENFSIIKY